jgi:hypothetical protein
LPIFEKYSDNQGRYASDFSYVMNDIDLGFSATLSDLPLEYGTYKEIPENWGTGGVNVDLQSIIKNAKFEATIHGSSSTYFECGSPIDEKNMAPLFLTGMCDMKGADFEIPFSTKVSDVLIENHISADGTFRKTIGGKEIWEQRFPWATPYVWGDVKIGLIPGVIFEVEGNSDVWVNVSGGCELTGTAKFKFEDGKIPTGSIDNLNMQDDWSLKDVDSLSSVTVRVKPYFLVSMIVEFYNVIGPELRIGPIITAVGNIKYPENTHRGE